MKEVMMNELTEGNRPNQGKDEWLPSGDLAKPTTESTVRLGIDPTNNIIKFTMEKVYGEDSTGQSDDSGHFIYVKSGTSIALTIELDSKWDWVFDDNPLAFKCKKDAENYKLFEHGPHSIIIWAKSTDPTPKKPTIGGAKTHGFNLYVLMNQTPHRAFPVRLDPDLKNPPPPLRAETTSGSVPII